MAKKVLVLTASPRKDGNTEKLADAFIKGVLAAGHSAEKFETAFRQIAGCKACNECWSTSTACSHKDDFGVLEPLLENCDVVVISSPLYWFSFPAQIKGAIDRLYAYSKTDARPLAIKESYLLLCGTDTDPEEYKGALFTYQWMGNMLGWKNRGILQIGGVDGENAIENSGHLRTAEEMGRGV